MRKITATIAVVAAITLVSGGSAWAGYVDEVLADNPVGYWRLGESSTASSAADEIAPADNGTYENSPTLGEAGALMFDTNTAAQMTGNGQVKIPDANKLDFGEGDFTVEVWVKTTAGASHEGILSKIDGGSRGFSMRVSPAGVARPFFRNPDVNLYGTTPINDDQWHHVVFGRGSGTLSLYVDGNLDTTESHSGDLTNAEPVYLGSYRNASHYPGLIDEAAFYGTWLGATRIQAHYNAATIIPEPSTFVLAAIGLLGLTLCSRRRRK